MYKGHESDSARHDTAMQRATASGLQHESHGPGVAATTERDETLQHPHCVYQILKRHFSRYTPEVVEAVCGVPREKFEEVCRAWTDNSGRERTTALVYAVGWTQHTVGVQYIRTGAIIQLLLRAAGRAPARGGDTGGPAVRPRPQRRRRRGRRVLPAARRAGGLRTTSGSHWPVPPSNWPPHGRSRRGSACSASPTARAAPAGCSAPAAASPSRARSARCWAAAAASSPPCPAPRCWRPPQPPGSASTRAAWPR
jgi:anaerobic selenocysteine-containing dehydrogenase